MSEPATADLQRLAREVFGRDISAAEAERYRVRLPVMARAARTLEAWAERLGETAPAAVHRVPQPEADGHERG